MHSLQNACGGSLCWPCERTTKDKCTVFGADFVQSQLNAASFHEGMKDLISLAFGKTAMHEAQWEQDVPSGTTSWLADTVNFVSGSRAQSLRVSMTAQGWLCLLWSSFTFMDSLMKCQAFFSQDSLAKLSLPLGAALVLYSGSTEGSRLWQSWVSSNTFNFTVLKYCCTSSTACS